VTAAVDGVPCALCDDRIGEGEESSPLNNGALRAHRECLLRAGIGGIGHLRDHAYWCALMHDPDAGLTYRESALQVDQWVADHGVAAAVNQPIEPRR
jgi:hypothetical protein